ncbi:NirD/YgiW/YdeI family stress tolerance protein [Halomonas alkaliantarctica]|nr:NirD/YgiW/YdeI family stress tolerance protein [Halomonas alkaliantarctica]
MYTTIRKRAFLHTVSMLGAAAAISLPMSAMAQVEGKPDGTWASLSGKVASHTPESFVLDYGEGTITVETDDWDSLGDGWAINEGDQVTVYGKIDDGFYQDKRIEASSVYVSDMDTVISAPSLADEEEVVPVAYTYFAVPTDYDLQMAGTVTSVSGREFTLDTGERKVSIDTLQMPYNPLDDTGMVKIEEGDFVSVSGDLDLSVFDEAEISAENVITYN